MRSISDGQVKVADFGLSGFIRPGSVDQVLGGALAYLAPETFIQKYNTGK